MVIVARQVRRMIRREHLPFSRRAEHTMAMPALRRRWTAAQVRSLIDSAKTHWPRYELVDGELIVTPAPTSVHQIAVAVFLHLLRSYFRDEPVGVALTSPADLTLQPESIVQPDVFVVPRHEEVEREGKFSWAEITSLLLTVEVISPGSVRTDRVDKRDYYMTSDVDEYWVVDVDARMIERWRRDIDTPEAVVSEFAWLPRGAREPLRVDAAALFRQIWSESRSIGGR